VGIEVTVIDDSDRVGWIASAVRGGELYMTSVASMVRVVIAHIGSRQMERLNILDHGSSRSLQIGADRIDTSTLSRFEPQLVRLQGRFSSGGFVHLHHCRVGQNRTLLVRLARIFGVPVYAGTGLQHAVLPVNTGDYVRARPDGTYTSGVGRP
jgi:hypothetical protein